MPDFTPRDEISDLSIASAHALVDARLHSRPTFPGILAIREPQAMWEVLITVARSVASVLRPQGLPEPGPIGLAQRDRVARLWEPSTPLHRSGAFDAVFRSATQLIGCAAEGDYPTCRAVAAVVLSAPDAGGRDGYGVHRGRYVLRAMLEILATEPQDPNTQEPTP